MTTAIRTCLVRLLQTNHRMEPTISLGLIVGGTMVVKSVWYAAVTLRCTSSTVIGIVRWPTTTSVRKMRMHTSRVVISEENRQPTKYSIRTTVAPHIQLPKFPQADRDKRRRHPPLKFS